MVEKVRAFAERKKLFLKGDRIIAAVSGGADSMALLEVLMRLRESLGYELAVLHVNHGLRKGTADRDEQFVTEFCRERGLPCMSYHVDVRACAKKNRLTIEEAARLLRYQAMEDAAESGGATAIAVAHHLNDQAETVLFQMIRGSGLKGLSGISPVRDACSEFGFRSKKLRVIRPLLCVDKAEILAFMKENGLSWCEDETNASDDASRNFLRHRVVPALTALREDSVRKIGETAEYLASVDAYLRKEAADWLLANCCPGARGKKGEIPEIPAAAFSRLDPVLRGYIVREILRGLRVSMKDVSRPQIEAAALLAEKPVGKYHLFTNGVRAERGYESIRFLPPGGAPPEPSAEAFRFESRSFPREAGAVFPENEYTKWFDCDKIKVPVELRTRREGDVFSAIPGGHKKLKDVFIDLKIPRGERDRIPLIASGRDILWIVGCRMSEEYKITPETRRILEIRIFPELPGEQGKENT